MRLQQGFAVGEMGFRIKLHGSNTEPLMSALGQKQTSDCRPLMSAIPPKADIAERHWDVRFVPKTDSCTAAIRLSQLTRRQAIETMQESSSRVSWQSSD
jgi:hypothetical protein